jgi:putative sterol carrier protein
MGPKQEFVDKVEAGQIEGKDILLFVEAIQELSDTNEDIQELLEDLKDEGEDFLLNFILPDTGRTASLSIVDGVLKASKELIKNPMIVINMPEPIALGILKGEMGILTAFKNGDITAEGELTKAAALGLLLNMAGDELGVL